MPNDDHAFVTEARSFLLDLDGCVWVGERLAPGAVELVRGLRSAGVALGFLSNTSWTNAAGAAEKLERLGIDASKHDVVTPMSVALARPELAPGARVLVLGTEAVADLLREAGRDVVTDPDAADAVLVGKDDELTYRRLATATQALVRGAVLVALNLDASVPSDGGRTLPGVGAIVAALTTASGTEPRLVGKPSRAFFRHALEHFGMDAQATVMVGDRLDSDVRGGKRAGLRTVLVGPEPGDVPAEDTPDLRVADLMALRSLVRGPPSAGPEPARS